ncbi:MAG: hypothetical protein J5793_01825 [Clostridia bacterium]|nr:hypothetical protein [Clostridia bacterium]
MGKSAAGADRSRRDRSLVIAGAIILCNPVIGMVDILPDAIGALLIFAGLTRASYSNDRFDRARKLALWIAVAEAVKHLFAIPVQTSGVSSNVLAAVAFSVVAEALLFILFFMNYFAGLDEESTKNGYTVTVEKLPSARFTAFVFTGIRLAANLAPELFAIPEVDREGPDLSLLSYDKLTALLSAKPFVTLFCIVGALVAGIWFAVRMAGVTKAFFREAGDSIIEKSEKRFYSDPEKTALRRLKYSLFAVNAGVFFALDLSFDGKPLLPASALYALLFAAAFILPRGEGAKAAKITAAVAFVLSAVNAVYSANFVVHDPVVIFETGIKTAAIAAALSVAAAVAGLLALRCTLSSLCGYAEEHQTVYRHSLIWFLFALALALSAVTETLPYLSAYLNFPRIAVAAAFIFCVWRENTYLLDSERKRVSLIPAPKNGDHGHGDN